MAKENTQRSFTVYKNAQHLFVRYIHLYKTLSTVHMHLYTNILVHMYVCSTYIFLYCILYIASIHTSRNHTKEDQFSSLTLPFLTVHKAPKSMFYMNHFSQQAFVSLYFFSPLLPASCGRKASKSVGVSGA